MDDKKDCCEWAGICLARSTVLLPSNCGFLVVLCSIFFIYTNFSCLLFTHWSDQYFFFNFTWWWRIGVELECEFYVLWTIYVLCSMLFDLCYFGDEIYVLVWFDFTLLIKQIVFYFFFPKLPMCDRKIFNSFIHSIWK